MNLRLSIFVCGLIFISCSNNHELINVKEIDSNIFIDSDGVAYFSYKDNNRYQIYTLQNGSIYPIIQSKRDLFTPFCYKGEICALYDNFGDEKWKTTSSSLNRQLHHCYLERIDSNSDGRFIVFQPKNTNQLLLLDIENSSILKIMEFKTRYHNVVFDERHNRMFISFDDKIIEHNLSTNITSEILSGTLGEKRNIHQSGDILYFNSNDTSEYHHIYKHSLKGNSTHPILVHKGNSDVMMPKIISGDLCFIQCNRNHYQLKCIRGKEEAIITESGVVYQYSTYDEDQILFSYSDFNLPRSLMTYNISKRELLNLTGESIPLDLKYEYCEMNDHLSPAYRIIPNQQIQGTLLFFHPGLNSDFSPRWDTIIMSLAQNGYEIICPNYPMSSGYGKTYNNASFQDAVYDMIAWKNKILCENNDYPLCLLASSSGNLVMEAVLYSDQRGVDGAISLFGLYNPRIPMTNISHLIILGKNDPIVDSETRAVQIENSLNKNIRVICFDDEGHWVRNNRNSTQMLDALFIFFETVSFSRD
ncbi:MAG: alpha/beta hydrolase [Fidelibacterota bacterium]